MIGAPGVGIKAEEIYFKWRTEAPALAFFGSIKIHPKISW
jgi:hypothetical protein